ncbi:ABC transporter C family member 2 (ABC transporter ABCC.2) (AtABCC2) (ATP-energized glutathione S-conjugate pump 2) (Glutathione S-conjugate-transporting ATPase 2) (Multidrug resistance-associated protein 2) [Durusdinium trenchii]|uniref:Uncharacterized protein n=1 Tax=Durusdinium trenchii TaxID=1381693 RepID=A0ABP0HCF8_9DINO
MDLESARGAAIPLSLEALEPLAPYQGSCFSRLFLTWVFPLLRRSLRAERLQPSELFEVEGEAHPEVLQRAFQDQWREQVRAGRGRPGWRLLKVLWRLHVPRLRRLWLLRVLQAILEFSFPLFLYKLVQFVEEEHASLWEGLLLSLLLFLAEAATALLDASASLGLQSCGNRIRASLTASIFRKVILLRSDSMMNFSSGKLNNMITTDADKAKRALRELHVLLLTAPLQVVISLVSLHGLMGASVFIGLSWMGVVILLNPALIYIMNRIDETQQAKTDERVRQVSEIISSINIIKCYGWEEPATAKVEEARSAELLWLWRLYSIYTVFEAIWTSIVPCCTALMFASYWWLHPEESLVARQAFTAIALMNMVQEPLFQIPWVLNLMVEANVAAKRIESLFFLAESQLPAIKGIPSFCALEQADEEGLEDRNQRSVLDDQTVVVFEKANFTWTREGDASSGSEDDDDERGEDADAEARGRSFHLRDLSFTVPRGAMVGIVGATGAGKSSLLQALLGEMPKEDSGAAEVSHQKPLSFLPQQPWIFNATVRQNILFGEPYSEAHYAECLRCCSLNSDLEQLASGDQTRVGEKGVALSGGQKARVCLARACYRLHSSSIFLLDDPYSALDAHVAKSVHEDAILGLLGKKTRIVAMNRLEFASSCDLLLVLEDGKISAMGPYDVLRRSSRILKGLLRAQGLEPEHSGESPTSDPSPRLDAAPPLLARATSGEGARPVATEETEEMEGGAKEDTEEERATGQVKKEVFFYYLRSMGGCRTVSLLVALYTFSEIVNLLQPIWLATWTAAVSQSGSLDRGETTHYLSIYVFLAIVVVVLSTCRDLGGNIFGFRAARRLHRQMFESVLHAPMSFFQEAPQGRIINRFSKDTSEIDKEVVWQMIFTFVPLLSVLGNFAMVGGIAYGAFVAFLPAFYFYFLLWKYYNKAVLDVKRISKVQSSPVYDHFNNLCRENAIAVVRAFRQAEPQCALSDHLLAEQQRADYSQMYLSQWFSLRIDHLGCLLLLLVSLFVTLGRGSLIQASAAALVLNFAGECTGSIESLIGQIAEFGIAFNAVERVQFYATQLPQEAARIGVARPPRGWPSQGRLEVQDLKVRYKVDQPLVLKGLSFVTSPGERLGVVGRTGAGKSSLLLALLRIVEPQTGSQLRLDGEDMLQLGLQDLRRGIAMIPQEPVLFQETLRYNCDPFDEHRSDDIWMALEEAQLAGWVREQFGREESKEKCLSLEIKEGGQNLSVGQRQMVAIARAVLRRSKLVVLDEATAAIDAQTDAEIQLAIRRCFQGATSLTIAHRLQTILDCDRIMVLSQGQIVELDSPEALRVQEGGIFRGMLESAEE